MLAAQMRSQGATAVKSLNRFEALQTSGAELSSQWLPPQMEARSAAQKPVITPMIGDTPDATASEIDNGTSEDKRRDLLAMSVVDLARALIRATVSPATALRAKCFEIGCPRRRGKCSSRNDARAAANSQSADFTKLARTCVRRRRGWTRGDRAVGFEAGEQRTLD